ncbi:MAG: biopolymer transporter ExbD [Hyphomonas sp.]|uniref:ExbD/TolR family protein n=1 Tax=Hyphomonas sp. TaxID=87 RepID=UPI003529BDE8
MRGRTQRAADEANVDLTPMLDVVFILLIFFIVTSTFAQEKALGLEPPPPPAPEQQEQQDVPAILIFVDESNLITVNGRPTDISSVRANIERVRAENPDSAVIIQAHPRTKSGVIVRIRDAAYDAGYKTGVNLVLSQAE